MTTSGAVTFAPEVSDLIDEAASRAGVSMRSGYDYQSAARSLNLLLTDMANRGLNLFSIDEGEVALSVGVSEYDLPADTVDVIALAVRSAQGQDFTVERVGVGTWANIPHKSQPGRPRQCWVERLRENPKLNLWPAPAEAETLRYWRMRRLQDAGAPHNTVDLPFRFWPALTAGLAYYLALKAPNADLNRVSFLRGEFNESLALAHREDRGRESFFIGIWSS